MSEAATTNRNYKDSLFRMIFREKKKLLNLYNAINGTHYTDPEELVVTTIEDVLYMSLKNDVSFLIDDVLNLYEHQSTWNPNMPLRGLFYISSLIRDILKATTWTSIPAFLLKLPTPRYIVFYNGTKDEPDRTRLQLSDSFIKKDGEPCVECTALMLNINHGHNRELMTACRELYEYAYFVEKVREFLKDGLTRDAAIDRAVEHCIEAGILKDFLILHRAEVKDVILTEYDEKRHEQTLIDQGIEIGKEQGIVIGKEQGIVIGEGQGVEIGKTEKAAEIATNMLNDGMSPEKVKQYVNLNDKQWADILKGAGLSD